MGLYTALTGVATGIGSVAGGWLATRGFLLAFLVAGAFVAVGALTVAAVWWQGRRPDPLAGQASSS